MSLKQYRAFYSVQCRRTYSDTWNMSCIFMSVNFVPGHFDGPSFVRHFQRPRLWICNNRRSWNEEIVTSRLLLLRRWLLHAILHQESFKPASHDCKRLDATRNWYRHGRTDGGTGELQPTGLPACPEARHSRSPGTRSPCPAALRRSGRNCTIIGTASTLTQRYFRNVSRCAFASLPQPSARHPNTAALQATRR